MSDTKNTFPDLRKGEVLIETNCIIECIHFWF